MGVAGGMMGAYFNELNRRVSLWRMQHLTQRWKRILELLAITIIMSVVSFILPLMWNSCTQIPTDTADWTAEQVAYWMI